MGQFACLTEYFAEPILMSNNKNDLPFRVLLFDGKSVVGGSHMPDDPLSFLVQVLTFICPGTNFRNVVLGRLHHNQ
jgi:hypothetical protein